ncbi:hypothetical protein DV735_g4584, partial [Chaetothyriales sp. CBS 134920]
MLILHQSGSVRVGEVVRYQLTYSPGLDRILPPPKHLHVKIKNTSAVPLRAAYLHGPYTLYVACYPITFNPFHKHERAEEEGAPDFEPQLKAGGHWTSKLTVPDDVYKDAESSPRNPSAAPKSFTWIIEIASQVIFSTSAAVHFELLVGRDEKSIELGFHGIIGSGKGAPGRLEDHQQGRARASAQPQGVFSKAVKLVVDDTASLWNTPSFPQFTNQGQTTPDTSQGTQHPEQRHAHPQDEKPQKKQKKIHLVLLTHGLHSNLGADMLFLKESIDAAARQARLDAQKRRQELRAQRTAEANHVGNAAINDHPKGIQYLGKRFAKYVLSITYPDQPYLPTKKKKSLSKSISRSFTGSSLRDGTRDKERKPIHKNSSILKDEKHLNLPYKITSISFIGHSLGGLIQTYAIAYIQKHSPEFFDLITPVNFVGMASPFLGLSNENPVYVRFALDFGLVGRTGQDLGLTWTPPTLARNGWGAVISGLGSASDNQKRDPNPGAKPLLRVLPTGPAHTALKKFRNRTVYSNVVNDGIVPLRTSCLLFLDWKGLERVEKARREYGIVGTVVEWGLAEVMGQNATAPKRPLLWSDLFADESRQRERQPSESPPVSDPVPQPEASPLVDQHLQNDQSRPNPPDDPLSLGTHDVQTQSAELGTDQGNNSLWTGFVSLFRPQKQDHLPKSAKIYRRGQTLKTIEEAADSNTTVGSDIGDPPGKPLARSASPYSGQTEHQELNAPPKTTFFESAGDVLNPPLPPRDFILDPSARPRTIFHDRVYHPDDIPPPPIKRQHTFTRRASSRASTLSLQSNSDTERPASVLSDSSETGSMRIEEKIARAYHRDLSWRKVLVRLEPDAHNNMVVRRMFANAYGWPVVKHMCDTHFAYTAAAQTRDEDERGIERADPADSAVGPEGEQVQGQLDAPTHSPARSSQDHPLPERRQSVDDAACAEDNVTEDNVVNSDSNILGVETPIMKRTPSETRESRDDLSDLVSHVSVAGCTASSYSGNKTGQATASLSRLARKDSGAWGDKYVEDSESDEDDEQILLELRLAQKRVEWWKHSLPN